MDTGNWIRPPSLVVPDVDWIAFGSMLVAVVAAIISALQAKDARAAASKQLKLTERIHREQNEPYVVVDIGPDRPGSSLLVLSIHNSGSTVARDVRITIRPEPESSDDRLTERLRMALSDPIAVLPPGRRLTYAFDTYQRWSTGLPEQFDVTVDANGPAGAVERLTYRIDLGVLAKALVGERPNKRVEDRLGKIADGVGKLARTYERANSEALRTELRRQARKDTGG